jgi:hypothetical protein
VHPVRIFWNFSTAIYRNLPQFGAIWRNLAQFGAIYLGLSRHSFSDGGSSVHMELSEIIMEINN